MKVGLDSEAEEEVDNLIVFLQVIETLRGKKYADQLKSEAQRSDRLENEKAELKQKLALKEREIEKMSSKLVVTETKYQEAESWRCHATTKMGTRCKRNAQSGGQYCWQH